MKVWTRFLSLKSLKLKWPTLLNGSKDQHKKDRRELDFSTLKKMSVFSPSLYPFKYIHRGIFVIFSIYPFILFWPSPFFSWIPGFEKTHTHTQCTFIILSFLPRIYPFKYIYRGILVIFSIYPLLLFWPSKSTAKYQKTQCRFIILSI